MKQYIIIITIMCIGEASFAQQGLVPLHSFYKDQLFANKGAAPYVDGSFLPACQSDFDLISVINDSSKQYYTLTEILFKKYLIEVKGNDYYLKISPALDFTYGRDLEDTLKRKLYQNTRGLHVEGDLFSNFSFSTSLYENQARFTLYESQYYSSLGELYPKSDSTYLTQNAVVPGGGRTKPFKGDAFDYAYAVGYFVYRPFKWLRVTAGNNPQFIGDGYRSLLLSDNSYSSPYIQFKWNIHPKFSFVYHRARLMNLMRRPASGSVEAYYEAKGYSVNYFTYKPTEKMAISLFEGNIWNRGDSITSKSSHPLYYNPIPVISSLILKGKNEVASLLGVNLSYQLFKSHRVYGQLAMNDLNGDKLGFQLGYRGYNFFKLNDLMLQVEYNYVPKKMYEVDNRRLNYVHFNLPIAHPKGNGFQEFVLRANYEYKRVFLDITSNYIQTSSYAATSLLPVYREDSLTANEIINLNLELGYRFNRKMNLMIFGGMAFRTINDGTPSTNHVYFGLRTGFTNHYRDI